MYESYYGFKEKPFNLNSTPEFLYQSENYRDVLSQLETSIRRHANFCILSGSAGTGKTTLCKALLQKLQSDFVCKMVSQSVSDQTNPLHTILSTFGLQTQGKNDFELISKGQELLSSTYLEQKRQAVLVVDDAHYLSEDQLEQYGSIMKLLTAEHPLLTILLVGKPALIENLNNAGPALSNDLLVLEPLTLEETSDFIIQRLHAAESERIDYFDEQAYQGIFEYSRGIPKLVNVFCHITLEYGAVQRKPWLGRALIDNVAKDSGVAALTDVSEEAHADHAIWENMSIASNSKMMAEAEKKLEEVEVDEATEMVSPLESTEAPENLVFRDNDEQNVLARQIAKAGQRNGNSAKPTFTYLDKAADDASNESQIKEKIREHIEEPFYDDEPTIKNDPIDRTTLSRLPNAGIPGEYAPVDGDKSPRKNLPLIAMGLVIAGIAVAFGFVQLFPMGAESKKSISDFMGSSNPDLANSEQIFSSETERLGDSASMPSDKFNSGGKPKPKNSDALDKADTWGRNTKGLGTNGKSKAGEPGSKGSGQDGPKSLADLQAIINRPIDRFTKENSQDDDGEPGFGNLDNTNAPLTDDNGQSGDQVGQLLTQAQQLYEQRMLTTPVGGSALDAYQEILLLQPNHPEALAGIEKIKQRYVDWSEVATQRGEVNNAIYYLEKASSLDPLNVKLMQALRDARKSQSSDPGYSREPAGQPGELDQPDNDTLIEQPLTVNNESRVKEPPVATTALENSTEQQPFTPPVNIENVSHKLLSDRDPSIVSIRAKIKGTIEKAEVLVSSAKGFVAYSMYDDATHGDTVRNDKIYYTLVRLKEKQPDTRFYIAAYTRTGGVIYSPNGADRETYRIRLQAASAAPARTAKFPIVINEFMASNNRTIKDPQGEYDGWVEIYNTSSKPVDLSGYYLSNNPAVPKKWQFPRGTKIGAQQYLLIWADNQPSDTKMTANGTELHANFRLSGDGGKIILVGNESQNNQLVDRVRFSDLENDQSISRVPNGSGRFNRSAGTTPGQSNNRRSTRVRPASVLTTPPETTSLR